MKNSSHRKLHIDFYVTAKKPYPHKGLKKQSSVYAIHVSLTNTQINHNFTHLIILGRAGTKPTSIELESTRMHFQYRQVYMMHGLHEC